MTFVFVARVLWPMPPLVPVASDGAKRPAAGNIVWLRGAQLALIPARGASEGTRVLARVEYSSG